MPSELHFALLQGRGASNGGGTSRFHQQRRHCQLLSLASVRYLQGFFLVHKKRGVKLQLVVVVLVTQSLLQQQLRRYVITLSRCHWVVCGYSQTALALQTLLGMMEGPKDKKKQIKSYSNYEKLYLLQDYNCRSAMGETSASIHASIQLPKQTLPKWKNNKEKISSWAPESKRMHHGMDSELEAHKQEILDFVVNKKKEHVDTLYQKCVNMLPR
jgi:hypothetical protein